jgi:hypothetical protein
MADKLFAFPVVLARAEGEEIWAAIYIKHPVECGSFERAPSPIDLSQGRQAVE